MPPTGAIDLLPGRAFGHLIAYRWWRFAYSDERPSSREQQGPSLLHSIAMMRCAWKPGEALWSVHQPVEKGCNGIYAFRSIGDALAYGEQFLSDWKPQPLILGQVALWGRIVEHERGFRAEYAYPYGWLALAYSRHPKVATFSPEETQQVLDLYKVRGQERPSRTYYFPLHLPRVRGPGHG